MNSWIRGERSSKAEMLAQPAINPNHMERHLALLFLAKAQRDPASNHSCRGRGLHSQSSSLSPETTNTLVQQIALRNFFNSWSGTLAPAHLICTSVSRVQATLSPGAPPAAGCRPYLEVGAKMSGNWRIQLEVVAFPLQTCANPIGSLHDRYLWFILLCSSCALGFLQKPFLLPSATR